MQDWSDLQSAVNFVSSSVNSQDRKKRKSALESLNSQLCEPQDESAEFSRLFGEIRNELWVCLNDPSEAVRDVVLTLLQNRYGKSEEYVEEVLPIVLHNLQGNEPSEEIRLKLVELLGVILSRKIADGFCGEIVAALVVSLEDKYPAVRQEAARCCVKLSANASEDLYKHAPLLTRPLISCLKHKHSKTRVLAVDGIAAVLKHADWKNMNPQIVFGSLGETLFDETPAVRLAIVRLLGIWFVEFRDRYSYFSRMIPLILSCVADDHPEVATQAREFWSAAGEKFLRENEGDLKDKLCFLNAKPDHYPKVVRPNLGCRELVQRNLMQITTPLIRELTDWNPAVCLKASSLLAEFVLHAESQLTQHAETILLALYKLVENPDELSPKFQENIERTADYMGHFIKPATWHKLVLPQLETEATRGKLFILSTLMRATPPGLLDPYSERLSAILSQRETCATKSPAVQLELLKCCSALLTNITEVPSTVARDLVHCLVYIIAVASCKSQEDTLADVGNECLKLLAEKLNTTRESLTKKQTLSLLMKIVDTIPGWTTGHPDFRLFVYILKLPKKTWTQQQEIIAKILMHALDPNEGNIEVKSYLFETLATSSQEWKECPEQIAEAVSDLIMKNLVWKAGNAAERFRTIVLACLHAMARKIETHLVFTDLLPILTGCVRDEPRLSRKLAQECIGFVIDELSNSGRHDLITLNAIFSKVVERLDDVDDEVRRAAVCNIEKLITEMPEDVKEETHNGVYGYFVKSLIPYIDDDNEFIRTAVYGILVKLGKRAPTAVKSTLQPKAHLFKSTELCEKLLGSLFKKN